MALTDKELHLLMWVKSWVSSNKTSNEEKPALIKIADTVFDDGKLKLIERYSLPSSNLSTGFDYHTRITTLETAPVEDYTGYVLKATSNIWKVDYRDVAIIDEDPVEARSKTFGTAGMIATGNLLLSWLAEMENGPIR